jgi:molybdate transport system substrate-binding protein
MDEIKTLFVQQHPEAQVKIAYGSSGKFRTQIANGAPFHLYFSADIHYPQMLKQEGLIEGEVTPYAKGRLVLWSQSIAKDNLTIERLTSDKIRRIAIANPLHAPYGKRTKEALLKKKLWSKLQGKLIRAENIAQTAQYALSGNAEVAITALSIALNPSMKKRGIFTLIDDSLHPPLLQGYAKIKQPDPPIFIETFLDFFHSEAAQKILLKYGFSLQ